MLRSDRHLSCFKQIFVSTVSNFCLKNYRLLKDSFFLVFLYFILVLKGDCKLVLQKKIVYGDFLKRPNIFCLWMSYHLPVYFYFAFLDTRYIIKIFIHALLVKSELNCC